MSISDKARQIGERPYSPTHGSWNGVTIRQHAVELFMSRMIGASQDHTLSGSSIWDAAKLIGIEFKDYKYEKHYPLVVAKAAECYADAYLETLAAAEVENGNK